MGLSISLELQDAQFLLGVTAPNIRGKKRKKKGEAAFYGSTAIAFTAWLLIANGVFVVYEAIPG